MSEEIKEGVLINKKPCKQCKKQSDKLKNGICQECLNKPKPKTYFDVKIECMLPATIIYRVFAEDAEQASSLIKGLSPSSVQYKINGKKDIKLIVYDAGCCVIKYIKKFF
jgi:hypothetical protein